MNLNVNFTGTTDDIMNDAIRRGIAKTKTEVLRIALYELKNKYNLLQNDEMTTEEKAILAKFIKSAKPEDYGTEQDLINLLK